MLCCAVLLSIFTVYVQQQYLTIHYLEEGHQIKRHVAVLQGTSGNAWQYRVLSEFLVEGVLRLYTNLNIPHPVAAAFLSFRVLQNALIFFCAALYYKRLGLNTYSTLLGLSLLAWGMTHAVFNSDLSLSTYSNIIFYLLAGLVILYERDWWIIPLTFVAALNIETCAFIPVMLLASRAQLRPRLRIPRATILIAALACFLYLLVFVGLRFYYGMNRPLTGPVGLDLIRWQLYDLKSWSQLFATLGILPVMALLAIRQWPRSLRSIFLGVAVWLIVIPVTGGLGLESRHYLAHQALVFVPGALFGAVRWGEKAKNNE